MLFVIFDSRFGADQRTEELAGRPRAWCGHCGYNGGLWDTRVCIRNSGILQFGLSRFVDLFDTGLQGWAWSEFFDVDWKVFLVTRFCESLVATVKLIFGNARIVKTSGCHSNALLRALESFPISRLNRFLAVAIHWTTMIAIVVTNHLLLFRHSTASTLIFISFFNFLEHALVAIDRTTIIGQLVISPRARWSAVALLCLVATHFHSSVVVTVAFVCSRINNSITLVFAYIRLHCHCSITLKFASFRCNKKHSLEYSSTMKISI